MNVNSLIELIKNIFDILLVWLVLYYVLKSLSKNVKMILLFKGIVLILILKLISDFFDLVTIGFLLDYVMIILNNL